MNKYYILTPIILFSTYIIFKKPIDNTINNIKKGYNFMFPNNIKYY